MKNKGLSVSTTWLCLELSHFVHKQISVRCWFEASAPYSVYAHDFASPRRRASLVNRLLRERDARLRTIAGSLAENSVASLNDVGCRTEERWSTIDSGQAKTNAGNEYSILDVDAGTSPAVDGSLGSGGEIFFASDLLDESSCADKKSEDTRSFNLRDLATGIFGRKIVTQDSGVSTPEKRPGTLAGEADFPNQRAEAVQRVQETDSLKEEESGSRPVGNPTEDTARVAITGRSGSRDNPCADLRGKSVHQNIEQDLYRDRGTAAAEGQSEGSATTKTTVKKGYNSRRQQKQIRAECRIKVWFTPGCPGGLHVAQTVCSSASQTSPTLRRSSQTCQQFA